MSTSGAAAAGRGEWRRCSLAHAVPGPVMCGAGAPPHAREDDDVTRRDRRGLCPLRTFPTKGPRASGHQYLVLGGSVSAGTEVVLGMGVNLGTEPAG